MHLELVVAVDVLELLIRANSNLVLTVQPVAKVTNLFVMVLPLVNRKKRAHGLEPKPKSLENVVHSLINIVHVRF